MRSLKFLTFWSICWLFSIVVDGHFCREGWCLEANAVPRSKIGDLCRLCSRIDNAEHRRGKLDTDGPWRCPLRCAANPTGYPLCGKVTDMQIPCKMSDLKHHKHSQPQHPPSSKDWDIQIELETPYQRQIDKRQKGRRGRRGAHGGGGGHKEENYYEFDFSEEHIQSIYNIDNHHQGEGRRTRRLKLSTEWSNQSNHSAIRQLFQTGNRKEIGHHQPRNGVTATPPLSDFHKLVLYDQSNDLNNSPHPLNHHPIYNNEYNKHYFEEKEKKKRAILQIHQNTFTLKSCAESDVVMQLESKALQCQVVNDIEQEKTHEEHQTDEGLKIDKGYTNTNIVTHLNLSAHQIGMCVIGNPQPFQNSKYREHLSAMLFSFKREVISQHGEFDIFIHSTHRPSDITTQTVSNSLKFLEPVSCVLHTHPLTLPEPCLKTGYADFTLMRSCMKDIENHELTARRNIPYRQILFLKSGFVSSHALPSLNQWFHLKQDILWTAIGPKQPRTLLKSSDDPVDEMFALLPRKFAPMYMKGPAKEMESCLPMVAGQARPLINSDKGNTQEKAEGVNQDATYEFKYKASDKLKTQANRINNRNIGSGTTTGVAVSSSSTRTSVGSGVGTGGSGGVSSSAGSGAGLIKWDNTASDVKSRIKRQRRRKGKMGLVGAAGHIEVRRRRRRSLMMSSGRPLAVNNNNNTVPTPPSSTDDDLAIVGSMVQPHNETLSLVRSQHERSSGHHRELLSSSSSSSSSVPVVVSNSNTCFKRWKLPACRIEQVIRHHQVERNIQVAAFPFHQYRFLCQNNENKCDEDRDNTVLVPPLSQCLSYSSFPQFAYPHALK